MSLVRVGKVVLDKRQKTGGVTLWRKEVQDRSKYKPHIGKKQIAKGKKT